MTTTLFGVVLALLVLLALRLIGRAVGLLLRLALLALLAVVLILALAPRHPGPGRWGPGERAPRHAMTLDGSQRPPAAPGSSASPGRQALFLRGGRPLTG